MATELAKAYVQIIPSAKGIKGKITEAMGGEAKEAGEKSGNQAGTSFGEMFKKAVVALGVGTFLKQTLMEGANLQQSIGGIETLFGAGGRSVEEYAERVGSSVEEIQGKYDSLMNAQSTMMRYADEAYRTVGVSANDYMQNVTGFAASLISSVGGDTERAAEAANTAMIDMADNANKMGTDMASIQNAYQGFAKQNYTMLDNLKLGYRGTKTEMERLLADAQALTGVEYNIDNLADVYSAIHVIQDQLDITGTTAKEATTTFTGSMSSMRAAASNLMANLSLGEDVTNSLSALGETVSNFLIGNLLPMVINIITAMPSAIAGVIKESGGILNDLLTKMFGVEEGNDIISGIISSIKDKLPELLNQGKEILQNIVAGITAALPELAKGALQIITELGTFLLEGLPSFIENGGEIILSLIQGIEEMLPELLNAAGEAVAQLLSGFIENLPGFLQSGMDIITSLIGGISDSFPALLDAAGEVISTIWNVIVETDWLQLGSDILTTLISGIGSILSSLGSMALEVGTRIWDTISGVDWIQLGKDILDWFIEGQMNTLSSIGETASEIAATIWDTITTTDWIQLGFDIVVWLINGLSNLLSNIILTSGEIAGAIRETITGVDWLQLGSDVLQWIIDGLSNLLSDAGEKAAEIGTSIWDTITSTDWLSLGSNIVQGIINGLGSMGDALWQAAKNVANSCLTAIKTALGIASPSKVMRDQIGKFIPAGIAVGINAASGEVEDAMDDLSNLVTDSDLTTQVRMGVSGSAAVGVGSPMNVSLQIGTFINNSDSDLDELAETLSEKIQSQVARREVALA